MKKIKKPKRQLDKLSRDQGEVLRGLGEGYFSGCHNESLSIFHLYQFIRFNDLFEGWDPVDDLDQVIRDCAKLSLTHINPRTLQYDVASVGQCLTDTFDGLQLVNKHLITSFLFPAATKFIIVFVKLKARDYACDQNIEDQLDGVPDGIGAVIQERLERPMLLSGLEQQQYMTRLQAAIASELRDYEIDERERYLEQVNQFVMMLTATRLSLQPTVH